MEPTLENVHFVLNVIKSSDWFDESNTQSPFYVYVHLRNDNKIIFYVGIGKGNRYKVSGDSKRNRLWMDIAEKAGGFNPVVVQRNVSRECAASIEEQFIEAFGRENNGTGSLANQTDGGDGGMLGYRFTPEQRERVKKAAILRFESSQARDKMRQSAIQAYDDPEKKKRHLDSVRTPENRRKLRKKIKESWSGNSKRKKQAAETIKKTTQRTDVRGKIGDYFRSNEQFTFVNVITSVEVEMTRSEFYNEFGLSRVQVTKLVTGAIKATEDGWVIKGQELNEFEIVDGKLMYKGKGEFSPISDKNIYKWFNKKTGVRVSCTRYRLMEDYPELLSSKISNVVNGNAKSHNGWVLAN